MYTGCLVAEIIRRGYISAFLDLVIDLLKSELYLKPICMFK